MLNFKLSIQKNCKNEQICACLLLTQRESDLNCWKFHRPYKFTYFFLKQNDILSDLIASWMFGGILIIKQLTSAVQIMIRFLSLRPFHVLVITWKYLIFIFTNNSPFIFFHAMIQFDTVHKGFKAKFFGKDNGFLHIYLAPSIDFLIPGRFQ